MISPEAFLTSRPATSAKFLEIVFWKIVGARVIISGRHSESPATTQPPAPKNSFHHACCAVPSNLSLSRYDIKRAAWLPRKALAMWVGMRSKGVKQRTHIERGHGAFRRVDLAESAFSLGARKKNEDCNAASDSEEHVKKQAKITIWKRTRNRSVWWTIGPTPRDNC